MTMYCEIGRFWSSASKDRQLTMMLKSGVSAAGMGLLGKGLLSALAPSSFALDMIRKIKCSVKLRIQVEVEIIVLRRGLSSERSMLPNRGGARSTRRLLHAAADLFDNGSPIIQQ